MSKRIFGILAGLLTGLCVTHSAFALGTSEAYYITFDEYVMNNADSSGITKSSSYDTDDVGGGVSNGSIMDASELTGVIAKHDFNKATGKVTWELCFDASSAPDEAQIKLMGGGKDAILLNCRSGGVYLATPKGETELAADGGFYGIKAFIDIDAGRYSMQVNGKTIGSNLEFLNKVEYLDRFWVETGKEATGGINLSVMRISQNYALNEWFLTSHSKVPDDFKTHGNGVTVERQDSSIQNDKYSLKIQDSDFLGQSGISHDVSYDSDELWFEYQFLAPNRVKEFGAALNSNGKEIIKVGFKNLEYGYWVNGEFTKAYDMRENLWYHAMVKLREDGAQIYINHKLVADKVPYEHVKIDNISMLTGKVATGTVYLDDIVAKPIYPLPEDYVPKPVVPERTTDTMVAVQSCTLWREGSHFGWDSLRPFEERTPYTGYYDEGSSEERDWETKWMVEHGIDAEIYCWYRNPDVRTGPIKRPRNSYGLHDGFFNSEYSNMMKFMISWENGGAQTTGLDDFSQNMVPYWIEQYYKDPRYLVIDNKPVMGIYLWRNLIRDFGTAEGAKAALDYLEKECINAGFDGIWYILTDGSADPGSLTAIKNMGIDALYCYSWGHDCQNIAIQKSGMSSQAAAGIMDILPTVSMGWDASPWERNVGDGGFADVEDYTDLLKWVRDTYIPSRPAGSLSRRLMTLDNWNEYCEGHYIMPSNLKGFGYVDAIREVFTANPEHEDAVPTEAQKARFTHLYVQDRHVEKSAAVKRVEKQKMENVEGAEYISIARYDFTDDESIDSYPIAKQIENLVMQGGTISGDSVQTDPGFFVNNINYPTIGIKQIKVRFRADVPNAKFQIYYITDTAKSWREPQSFSSTVDTNGEWVDIVLDTAGADGWVGSLTSLRIDPMASTGHFEIDYIDILGIEVSAVQPVSFDGVPVYAAGEIPTIGGRMYVPAGEFASPLGYKWCNSLDGKYLRLLNDNVIIELEYGADALLIDGEAYFALRGVAEKAGYRVEWKAETNSVNLVTPGAEDEVEVPPDPFGQYNFNKRGETPGMTSFGNMSNRTVANGVFTATATTADPMFQLTNAYKAAEYPYCNIRIKNNSAGNTFKVYFQTENDRVWNETKSVHIVMSAKDSEYKTYVIDMSSNPLWKGTIPAIRIDPTDGTGKFSIDYIIFSNKPVVEASSDSGNGTNIITGGIMENKELSYSATGLTAQYTSKDGYNGRYSLKLISDSENGYVKIPADIKAGNKYKLTLAVKSSGVGTIKAGMYYADGSLGEAEEIAVTPGAWKAAALGTKTAASAAAGIYIMPGAGEVLIDNLRLGETVVEKQAEDNKPTDEPKKREQAKTGPLKVLIIGNSITQHDKSESIGWLGDWGMAATSPEKDYVHLLMSYAKQKDKTIEFKWRNISEFERNFYDFSLFNTDNYQELVDYDADIIICAFGANIKNPTNENDPTFATKNEFKPEHYAKIVDFFAPYGDAYVIAGLTPLTSYDVREKTRQCAEEKSWALVDSSQYNTDEYMAVGYRDADVFGDNVIPGVLGHPGDLGMQKIAEEYWKELSKAIDERKR